MGQDTEHWDEGLTSQETGMSGRAHVCAVVRDFPGSPGNTAPKAQPERGREVGTGRRKEDRAREQYGGRRSCSFDKRGRKDHL